MSGNSRLIGSKGFVKRIKFTFDDFQRVLEVQYTDTIIEAKEFTTRQANNFIQNNKLDLFIWNPYKETPIRNRWDVVRKRSDSYFPTERETMSWEARKVIMLSKTDVKFLCKKGNLNNYYSEEEAISEALERNNKIIIDLQNEILTLTNHKK